MEENPSHRASRRGSPGASMGAEDGHGTPTQSTAAYGGTPYGYATGGYAQNAYVPYKQRQNQSHYGFQHAYYNPAMTPMRGDGAAMTRRWCGQRRFMLLVDKRLRRWLSG